MKIRAPAWLFLFACACGPIEPAGTPGALKEGGFVYCEDPKAPCVGDAPIPDHIAVGSAFAIQFTEPDVTLSSPDTTSLEVTDSLQDGTTSFRALRASTASVEARSTSNKNLVDFVRLDLADVDHLELRLCPRAFNAIESSLRTFEPSQCGGTSATSEIDISLGRALAPTLCAFALDGSGNELSGTLSLNWLGTAGLDAEIEVVVGADSRCATIGGLTTGSASVSVVNASGTGNGSLSIVVGP